MSNNPNDSIAKKIFGAGLAAVTTVTFIHPIDVVKTRLQIVGEAGRQTKAYGGVLGTVKTIAADEGLGAFYKGIKAAWLRESSYTSLRLGLYEPMKDLFGAGKKDAAFWRKFCAGAAAGAIGSVVGNPFDVLKTRMMANEKAGDGSGFFKAFHEVVEIQGYGGFYKGLSANVTRAMVLNATKMAVYDQTKQMIKTSGIIKEGLMLHFSSAFTAGFFMAITVSPFDIVRTRLMNQPKEKIYNGMIDCFGKIIKNEGPMGLYKGFIPIWGRFAPTTTLQLVIFEQIRSMMGMKAL